VQIGLFSKDLNVIEFFIVVSIPVKKKCLQNFPVDLLWGQKHGSFLMCGRKRRTAKPERNMMKSKQQRILEIAKGAIFDLETLERRGHDSLDFFEISVWSFKDALEAAYQLGREDEKRSQERKGRK